MTVSSIRPATPADHDAIARICRLTGDAGADATGMYGDDTVLADVYATPYLHGPGAFALVWAEGDGPLGYVLGTEDTVAFQTWFSEHWWPAVADHHALVTEADEKLLRSAANRHRMLDDLPDGYPAHLHIDLLPESQGRGAGRALIEAACALLAERGAAGVHLGIDPRNDGARMFYPRVGFTVGASEDLFLRRLASP
ncbi:GNAT family N-acetyltransferase [Demequina sp. NBRC 110051]|uniref:GNAT family N-acetyltransferase n=1 Tax=Demequina sp. NBRC 110051 TaxID=1570340 RepID=UPI0009FE4593|nr:GNAT family N-acetyltransferase [Demequina sp. NBRC 110051]